MVGHDFELECHGSSPVLGLSHRLRGLAQAFFPDAVLTRCRKKADAILTRRPSFDPWQLGVRPGFLRPPSVAGRSGAMHSLTLTNQGRSWSDRILVQDGWFTPALAARADEVRRFLIEHRLGGSFWGGKPHRRVAGHAVVVASHDAALTRGMLMQAIERHGADRTILLSAGKAVLPAMVRRLGVAVLEGVFDPWAVAEEAACLYVGGEADAGLVGRLVGIPVHVCSRGFLSRTADPCRLIAATVLLGSRYVDPFDESVCTAEDFLQRAAEWRRQSGRKGEIGCFVGMSFWKRRRIREMFSPAGRPAFRRTAKAALAIASRRHGTIAAWASRIPPDLQAYSQKAGLQITLIEDGFVRSVGLGADFLPPLSMVLDRSGLYYDSTKPSDLENILSSSRFDDALLERATMLRQRMVAAGVTKYNLAGPRAEIQTRPGQRAILVPGQVADDRSVLLGGGGGRAGLALLEAVRKAEPDAFIIYKPHPDVEAGHRIGAIADSEALLQADMVVRGGSMAALLEQIHEVHTLTSLTGFEALLRGIPVTTYGQPFYAGWGLTTDRNPIERRTRRLTIEELVAGALILYPFYHDPISLLPCGPETVLDRLSNPAMLVRMKKVGWLVWARRLQGHVAARVSRHLSARTSWGLSKGPAR